IVRKNAVWLLPVALLLGFVFVGFYFINDHTNFFIFNLYFETVMYFYVVLLSLALLGLGQRWNDKPTFWLTRGLKSIGHYSFSIYLVHPMLQGIVEGKGKPPGNIWLYDGYIIASVLAILLGSWLLSYLYARIKFTRLR